MRTSRDAPRYQRAVDLLRGVRVLDFDRAAAEGYDRESRHAREVSHVAGDEGGMMGGHDGRDPEIRIRQAEPGSLEDWRRGAR